MTGTDPMPAIFFLSDYGTADEFVGVVHAVLHRLAPALPVIDLSHQVPPFDVASGAAMLVRCAPSLGAGVVLAVVDPGVGTGRRGVAIGVLGDGPRWLVGPDNGLLVPMADDLGAVDRVIHLDPVRFGPDRPALPPTGGTFDGRDVFAPAAAHLAMGGAGEDLGTTVDPASLARLPSGQPGHDDRVDPASSGSEVVATVSWIDHFGNVQLRLRPGVLEGMGLLVGGTAEVTVEGDRAEGHPADRSTRARRVDSFAALGEDECGLILDSNGRMALVINRASAARRLHIEGPGESIRISVPSVHETRS